MPGGPQDWGQEAASKKSDFNQNDTSNPYSQVSQQQQQNENNNIRNRQIANRINKEQQEAAKQRAIKEAFIQKSKRENVTKNPFTNFGAWTNKKGNNLRRKLEQAYIEKNKDANLEELGVIDSQYNFGIGGIKIPSFVSGAAAAFKVDPNTKYFDEGSIKEIGSQLQYTPTTDPITGKTTYGMTGNQTNTLGDLKEDILMQDGKGYRDFDKYMNRNKIVTREGNDNILPQYAMMGGGADMGSEDAPYVNDFDYRFGNIQGIGKDVTEGYYNGGRARRAFGGIMDTTTGRKAYGIGSIFKSVKKAVGKVLKSDIGKAAIIGAGIYGYNAGWGANISSFAKKIPGHGFLMGGGKGDIYKDKFNPWKVAGLAMTAAPFIKGAPWNKVPENEDIGMRERGGQLIDPITKQPNNMAGMRENIELAKLEADGDPTKLAELNALYNNMLFTHVPYQAHGIQQAANGGRIGKAEGGLMDLGGMEKDYRAEGGFVPIGEYEKKDDVPARLSVNEFVFTADAVRGAGQGDIDKGAEIMENMMVNLEKGGTVSEESQGNAGAQQMFDTSERLGEVI